MKKDIYKLFEKEIWKPDDFTDCFWYENTWGINWSYEGEESQNPDDWENGGYVTDRVRNKTVRDGYMIATLDDGCGGQYQAIFSVSKEIKGS